MSAMAAPMEPRGQGHAAAKPAAQHPESEPAAEPTPMGEALGLQQAEIDQLQVRHELMTEAMNAMQM